MVYEIWLNVSAAPHCKLFLRLHSSTEQRVAFAHLVTDYFRDGNCCELLPLSTLFLSATLVPRLALRVWGELRRKLLQLPDPALLAIRKVKNSHFFEEQCGELDLRRAFFE